MDHAKLEAVNRMKDFIDRHIQDVITLHMLAAEAGYSYYYSARIFKEVTGKTPFDYIRIRRLTLSALSLRPRNCKIIDVAFDFVFDSHEGFTRAFSKQFGMTPRQFRDDIPPLKLFMNPCIKKLYLTKNHGADHMTNHQNANTVFVQVVERPARKAIVKYGVKATHYFEYCDEVGCEVWDILSGIKDAINEPLGMWMPKSLRKAGTSEYIQGVEVSKDYTGEIPEGFDIIDLPPCKVMVFQGPPYNDADFEEAITNLWNVIKTYNPELYGFSWDDEAGPRFQMAPMGYRGYIEGRPVKVINK